MEVIPSRSLTMRPCPTVVRAGTTFSRSNYEADENYNTIHLSFSTSIRTPPLLPIPLPAPSTSRRAYIPEADTPPRKRLLLTTPKPGCEMERSSAALQLARTAMTHYRDQTLDILKEDDDRLRLVNRRVTLPGRCLRLEESSSFAHTSKRCQRSCQLVRLRMRSEAHCRALEARVTVLETEVRRHEWQRQAADDLAVQHI
ncbi:hypothetical protein Tco_0058413 [Tanacetum coccineum]